MIRTISMMNKLTNWLPTTMHLGFLMRMRKSCIIRKRPYSLKIPPERHSNLIRAGPPEGQRAVGPLQFRAGTSNWGREQKWSSWSRQRSLEMIRCLEMIGQGNQMRQLLRSSARAPKRSPARHHSSKWKRSTVGNTHIISFVNQSTSLPLWTQFKVNHLATTTVAESQAREAKEKINSRTWVGRPPVELMERMQLKMTSLISRGLAGLLGWTRRTEQILTYWTHKSEMTMIRRSQMTICYMSRTAFKMVGHWDREASSGLWECPKSYQMRRPGEGQPSKADDKRPRPNRV